MSDEILRRANIRRWRGGRRTTPSVLQMEATECGAACLGMILAYFGRWVPLEDLRVRCGVSRDGSNAASVVRAAREFGLNARGYRREPARLFDLPFPMIVFWEFNHFVVLEGIRGNSYYINDPAEGARRLTSEEFDEKFTGVCLAFIRGPGSAAAARRPRFAGLAFAARQGALPLALVFLVTLILVVPGVGIPALTKVFVDDVLIPRNDGLLMPLLIGLGLSALLQGVLTWLQQRCLARMETKLSLVASSRFMWHVATLPMVFFSQRYAGDISNRIMSNDKVAAMISGDLATNAINMLTMAVYAVVMLFYDPLLMLIALATVALNLLALRMVSRARDRESRRLLKEHSKVVSMSVNGLHMIETIKASGAEDDFFSKWSGTHANALAAQQELGVFTNVLNIVPPLLASFTTVAILGIGGLRILEGALTIGGLVAFQALARSFSQPIEGLVRFAADLQTVKADIARLDDVLNYKTDPRVARGMTELASSVPPPSRGHLVLDSITFGYNSKLPPLVDNFTLTIRPGERVALVGGSGSGKSTIGKLACGLLEPWSGTVRIEGRLLEELPSSHLAQLVSYVDQEVVLFEGTVRDNVTLWNSSVDERELVQALRDTQIHGDVTARPGRYDTRVDENGRNFSGGQRQRLEIARALVCAPGIVVLDEATAALDPLTELEIDTAIRRRGCSSLIIAHRLSTIRDADRIIVLDSGRVVQQGTHSDLLQEDGLYRTLVSAN